VSNPDLVGDITSTQITDAWFHGCGLTNYFRELKPALADAYNDMAQKVRWCLFVEPIQRWIKHVASEHVGVTRGHLFAIVTSQGLRLQIDAEA